MDKDSAQTSSTPKHAGDEKPHKGIENLRPCKDTETAKARGKLGGIESGKAKREKKRISQIYADFLEEEFEIEISATEKSKMSGADLVNKMIKLVLMRGDAATVSLLKEVREATEGSKIGGLDGGPIEIYQLSPKERAARIAELLSKATS